MLKKHKSLLLILALSLHLSGCGFKLRSIDSLPPQLNRVYYQAKNPYEKFELNFKRTLKSSGTILLNQPEKSAPVLNIASNYYYANNNPASSTQARIYTLTYSASITITDYKDNILTPKRSANVSRTITLQPNEVFEGTPQVEIVKNEMIQELSNKLLNILSSPQIFNDLEKRSL
jgi:LPS-assembly lipoprotein